MAPSPLPLKRKLHQKLRARGSHPTAPASAANDAPTRAPFHKSRVNTTMVLFKSTGIRMAGSVDPVTGALATGSNHMLVPGSTGLMLWNMAIPTDQAPQNGGIQTGHAGILEMPSLVEPMLISHMPTRHPLMAAWPVVKERSQWEVGRPVRMSSPMMGLGQRA